MKAQTYTIEGKASGEIAMPSIFDEAVRPDLISRAAISDQTWEYQPKGNDPRAGMETSARYRGRKEDFGSIKNMGISRLPREVLTGGRFGKVKRIPSAVKGRRAHPPHVEKTIVELMNRKEYTKALHSALAATCDVKSVEGRGHKIPPTLKLPIVFDEGAEKAMKTKQMLKALEAIGFGADLERARVPHLRSGVGARKGGATRARSLLIVVAKDCPLAHSARNIAGVDVVEAGRLRVIDLAPGATAGRLTAYTKSALDALAHRK